MWNEQDQLALLEALDRYDRSRAKELCDKLVRHLRTLFQPFDESAASTILKGLRRKRYFALMQLVADALLENGQGSPVVRKLYAQALVDRGQLNVARRFLVDLVEDEEVPDGSKENLEGRGLLGRLHKQRYVDAKGKGTRAQAELKEAIAWYHGVFEKYRKEHWHGVNAAACLRRAYRDGVDPGMADPIGVAKGIAEEVLAQVEEAWLDGAASLWHIASAGEASLVSDDHEGAAMWYGRYAGNRGGDAFEIASTLRQLEEVWELDTESEPGATLLPLLRAALLSREGGTNDLSEDAVFDLGSLAGKGKEDLEKVFGATSYVSFSLMLKAIERGRSVARIESDGEGFGTGFLVRGGDLFEPWGDGQLLVTNAHVISDDDAVVASYGSLDPDEAAVAFKFLDPGDGARYVDIEELLWTSPPDQHDVTVLRLAEQVADLEPYDIAKRLPVLGGQSEPRVYVVGHPRGGGLAFSMQDNLLLDHEGPGGTPPREEVRRLHYRAPTDGGSSGSPVFNKSWDLIGVHHAGGTELRHLNGKPGFHAANEAIWIHSIREAIARRLSA